jgi:hypothetical protein
VDFTLDTLTDGRAFARSISSTISRGNLYQRNNLGLAPQSIGLLHSGVIGLGVSGCAIAAPAARQSSPSEAVALTGACSIANLVVTNVPVAAVVNQQPGAVVGDWKAVRATRTNRLPPVDYGPGVRGQQYLTGHRGTRCEN